MAKRKKTPRLPGKFKVCPRVECGLAHHPYAKCADGLRLHAGKEFVKKGLASRAELPSAEVVAEAPGSMPAPAAAPVSEAERARDDLRTMIAALPADSPQRHSLQLLLDRDEARVKHERDETEYQVQTSNPAARLPLPTIIREKNEKRGREVLAQLDRVMAEANLAQDPRAKPPREEVMLVKETLAALPAKRDAEAAAARAAAQQPPHMPGEEFWHCGDCGKRFTAGTLEQVRRKARAEPDWRFVCPHCGGKHVGLYMAA